MFFWVTLYVCWLIV